VLRKLTPVSDTYDGQRFWTRSNGIAMATPLLAVLVAVEAADLVFAVDSIPAVLAISDDTFIVYTSNAFAILGLRSLYFLLSGLLGKFRYLGTGLGVVLGFIGLKMLISDLWHVPVWASLGVIAVVLTGSVLLSLRAASRASGVSSTSSTSSAEDASEPVPTDHR